MNKKFINIISICVIAAVLAALPSCKGKTGSENETPTSVREKSVTSETVKIVNIPTEKSELTDMLNAALNYVDSYCYTYKKSVKCTADSISLGSLSSASNASDAFASIFGEKDITADFDYKADKNLFADNFVKGPISQDSISSITAKQDGNTVVVTAELTGETNPTAESGVLCNLGGDFVSVDDVNASLEEFKSSASSVSISADSIKLVARISTDDSSLKALTVSYTERFSLSGVTLVKLKGGAVSGAAQTKVEYTNFGLF